MYESFKTVISLARYEASNRTAGKIVFERAIKRIDDWTKTQIKVWDR